MPRAPLSTGTPNETLYGTHANGNLPWKSRYLHDLAQEAHNVYGTPYTRPPSRIAPRNRLQNLATARIERLLGEEPQELTDPFSISPQELVERLRSVFGDISPDHITNEMLREAGFSNTGNEAAQKRRLEGIQEAIAQGLPKAASSPAAAPISPGTFDFAQFAKKPFDFSQFSKRPPAAAKSPTTFDFSQFSKRPAPPIAATTPNIAKTRVGQAKQDAFDIASKEIRDTFDKSHRNKFLGNLENVSRDPFSEGTTDQAIIDKVSGRYNKVGDALIKKMGKNYLENIAPQVDYNYIKNGVFNSPLRLEHRKRVYQNLEERLAPELARLGALGEKEGLEELNQHKLRKLQSTDLGHKIISDEKDRANLAARNLRENEQGKLAAEIAKIEALRQAGHEEQAQHEARLAEDYFEGLAQKEHPIRMVEREAALAQGLPATADIPAYRMMSLRPNHAATGANALGTFASAALHQNKKAGGMVKKYAPGGFVLPQVKQTPQDLQMQHQIEAMHHHNPHEAMLHAIARGGAETARRHGQTAFSDIAADTYFEHQQKNQVQKERAIGLMQKIQESRLRQQDIMAHYDHQQKALDEQTRHHRTMEGHQAQALAARQSGTGGMTEMVGPDGTIKYLPRGLKETASARERAKNNRKIREMYVNPKTDIQTVIKDSKKLKQLIDESKMDTGATTEFISGIPGIGPHLASMLGAGNQTEQNKFDKTTADLINAQTKALGSSATDAQRAQIAASKPTRKNTSKANQEIVSEHILPEAENRLAKALFIEEFVRKGLGDEQDALEAYEDNLRPHEEAAAPSRSAIMAELKRRGLM